MNEVIKVENLGKKYIIRHQQQVEQYDTLRDAISNNIKNITKKIIKPKKAKSNNTPKNEEFWALKNVSFNIRQGDRIGIIGRNGAGKTTLLKLLSRITEPSEGRIKIKGRVASLLEVGTGFHPELTGRENIFLNGAILGMGRKEIRNKFEEIVSFAEVEKFLDTPVKRYSSGMYVRLAFAVAAHLNPEILLVDEVLAVGDSRFQQKCIGKIKKVGNEGRTVIFVSHNMGTISDLCPKCILLSSGRIVRYGKTSDVITKYLTENSLKGEINLNNYSLNRTGKGSLRVVYLSTMNKNGDIISNFISGKPIVFYLKVTGNPGSSCILGISIRDSYGNLILHLNNTDDNKKIILNKKETEIKVKLKENLLNNGTYYITIWLGDNLSILHDRIYNCLEFVVDNSIKGFVRCRSPIKIKAEWFTN